MKGNRNPNTRAIVSALQCDYRELRAAAAAIVDEALVGDREPKMLLQLAFDASRPTADRIMRERGKVTKSGARRR